MKRPARRPLVPALALVTLAAACFSTARERRVHVLEYLYPEGTAAVPATVVRLELPLTVGVAFVPEENAYDQAIGVNEQQRLLERVREAFLGSPEIERIEVVPASFVTHRGGFENLRQIRSALGIDLVALLSYDQAQFDDPNMASITYWTLVGAYVVPGNENETHTLVDASIFDIESEALLFNASGQSLVEGSSTAIDLERSMREDRHAGFLQAVEDLIPQLEAALGRFREQVKAGTVRGAGTPAVEIAPAPRATSGGGVGVGSLGAAGLGLGFLVLLAGRRGRPRP